MWPSTLMCDRMMARLSEAGFRFSSEHLALEAGHNVSADSRFWPKIVSFLKREFLGALVGPSAA
jgi:hypothetical protein